jgi:hypothetical protein
MDHPVRILDFDYVCEHNTDGATMRYTLVRDFTRYGTVVFQVVFSIYPSSEMRNAFFKFGLLLSHS